ncbi:MAG: hypothetical protein LBC92_04310 [Rickettsiales bacterium]|jgi:hypothetical protein|nr:hypothetical protein [Rickettsiales bacterium]
MDEKMRFGGILYNALSKEIEFKGLFGDKQQPPKLTSVGMKSVLEEVKSVLDKNCSNKEADKNDDSIGAIVGILFYAYNDAPSRLKDKILEEVFSRDIDKSLLKEVNRIIITLKNDVATDYYHGVVNSKILNIKGQSPSGNILISNHKEGNPLTMSIYTLQGFLSESSHFIEDFNTYRSENGKKYRESDQYKLYESLDNVLPILLDAYLKVRVSIEKDVGKNGINFEDDTQVSKLKQKIDEILSKCNSVEAAEDPEAVASFMGLMAYTFANARSENRKEILKMIDNYFSKSNIANIGFLKNIQTKFLSPAINSLRNLQENKDEKYVDSGEGLKLNCYGNSMRITLENALFMLNMSNNAVECVEKNVNAAMQGFGIAVGSLLENAVSVDKKVAEENNKSPTSSEVNKELASESTPQKQPPTISASNDADSLDERKKKANLATILHNASFRKKCWNADGDYVPINDNSLNNCELKLRLRDYRRETTDEKACDMMATEIEHRLKDIKSRPSDAYKIAEIIGVFLFANDICYLNKGEEREKILKVILNNVEPELLKKVEITLKEILSTVNSLDNNGRIEGTNASGAEYGFTKSSDGKSISFNQIRQIENGKLVSNDIDEKGIVESLNNTINLLIKQCQDMGQGVIAQQEQTELKPEIEEMKAVKQQKSIAPSPNHTPGNSIRSQPNLHTTEQQSIIKPETEVRQKQDENNIPFSPLSDSSGIPPKCSNVYNGHNNLAFCRHPEYTFYNPSSSTRFSNSTPNNAAISTIKEKPNITLTSLFSEESEEDKRIRNNKIAQLGEITKIKREKKEAKKEAFKNWCKELNRDYFKGNTIMGLLSEKRGSRTLSK